MLWGRFTRTSKQISLCQRDVCILFYYPLFLEKRVESAHFSRAKNISNSYKIGRDLFWARHGDFSSLMLYDKQKKVHDSHSKTEL